MASVNDAASETRAPRGSRGPGAGLVVVLVLAVIASGAFAAYAVNHRSTTTTGLVRVTGIPSNISTATANLMALSPVPAHAAPGFTLTDQNGHTLSLSSFKGRAVILEFMDPHCTDICPLVAQEYIDAYRDLGALARKVVFMAVNVNQYYASVANMMTFSKEHSLTTIPSWHFFTGAPPALRAVWRDYNIEVIAKNPNADIIHTSALYVIDPRGRERFFAAPVVMHRASGTAYLPANTLTAWGQGIATLARDVLN
ncbi:MAG: SCO family protein [Acidobacteriota bacterium]|nr:SCO family protein [Acidobacteriota bacterium]